MGNSLSKLSFVQLLTIAIVTNPLLNLCPFSSKRVTNAIELSRTAESFFTENGIYKESCLTTPTKTVKAVSKICSYVVNNMNTTTLKTASESITPILGYAMPLMMNAASYEDKSLLEALCIELSEKYDNNKELSSQNTTN